MIYKLNYNFRAATTRQIVKNSKPLERLFVFCHTYLIKFLALKLREYIEFGVLFFLFCLFSLVNPTSSYGFREDFSGGFDNPDSWSVANSSLLLANQLSFTSEKISLSGNNTSRFPFIISTGQIIPNGKSYIEIGFKYNTSGTSYGDGIAITDHLPTVDQLMNFPSSFLENAIVYIWHDQVFNLHIGTSLCISLPTPILPCETTIVFPYKSVNPSFSDHVLRVEQDTGVYTVYLDGAQVFVSTHTNREMSSVWIGHPSYLGQGVWSMLDVDFVETNKLQEENKKIKTILLPGFGGSWNYDALLRNSNGGSWTIPGFITIYNDLISSFENAGYIRDADLFVFAYDWRKPISLLASDLNTYVSDLVAAGKLETDEKINLVGHSYGGLVSRGYLQSFGSSRVNKLVTVGSPSRGLVDAYGAWEGAEPWSDQWWFRAAFSLLINRAALPGEIRVDTVRRVMPSIKDLLPNFDYVSKNNVLKNWGAMGQINNNLKSLNDSVAPFQSFVTAHGGSGFDTKQKIKIQERSWLDSVYHKWEDGKPIFNIPFEKSDLGDSAVLVDSAVGNFVTSKTLAGLGHGDIVDKKAGIEAIFNTLGLDETKTVDTSSTDNRKRVLVVGLRSPGTLRVCKLSTCDSSLGVYLSTEKLFMLPGYDGSTVDVSVLSNGESGDYLLDVGDIEDAEQWETIPGNISPSDQSDNYVVSSSATLGIFGKVTTDRDETLTDALNFLEKNYNNKKIADLVAKTVKERSVLKKLELLNRLQELISDEIVYWNKKNNYSRTSSLLVFWKSLSTYIDSITSTNLFPKKLVDLGIRAMEEYSEWTGNQLKKKPTVIKADLLTEALTTIASAKINKGTMNDLALQQLNTVRIFLKTALLL